MDFLVFILLAPFAAVLGLVVGVVAWRRRRVPGGQALVALSVFEFGWLACNTLSLLASSPETTLRLAQLGYLWIPFTAASWLAFVLAYTDRLTRTTRALLGVLLVAGALYDGLVLTSGAHDLVWKAATFTVQEPFLWLDFTLGPATWALAFTVWAVVGGSFVIVLRAYTDASRHARHLSRWIVAGAAVPLVINVAVVLELWPVQKDFTPIALAVSSGAFAFAFTRYRFLDLRPIARTALVESLQEAMLVLDTEGRVVDANPALRRLLGEPDALIGRPIQDVLTPAQAQASRVLQGRHDARTELAFEHDGATSYYEVRISPLTDRSGQPSGRLILLHDVTRRRLQEAALHEANAELQARNAELDAFAHTVAHDLKNSIQGVLGYAEILVDEGQELPPELHQEMAGEVVRTAKKMDSVVQELLLLAGVRQATVESVPLAMHAVVSEALTRVQPALDEAGATVEHLDAWPIARGHHPWVEEVWVNYLSNAAKYGGHPPHIRLGADLTADGTARFWVHDNGPGLRPDAQAQLFVPFSRVTERAVEGTGLGLSIVRRIVEKLGGACGVESTLGEGCRFWFTLPLALVPADEGSITSRPPIAAAA